MSSILLVGGGGHCRSCIDVIEAEGRYTIVGIVQPESHEGETVFGYPVIGADENLPKLLKKTNKAVVTVGQIKSSEIRVRLYQKLMQLHAELPVIISPHAYCSPKAVIAQGTIMLHGSVVNAGANIGENCIINSQALIEHDATVNAHCHISTGARVNGGVQIGEGCFIGSGAILRESINIGNRVVIGAGQTVLNDVQDNSIIRSNHV